MKVQVYEEEEWYPFLSLNPKHGYEEFITDLSEEQIKRFNEIIEDFVEMQKFLTEKRNQN